jgi:hypothetical protein
MVRSSSWDNILALNCLVRAVSKFRLLGVIRVREAAASWSAKSLYLPEPIVINLKIFRIFTLNPANAASFCNVEMGRQSAYTQTVMVQGLANDTNGQIFSRTRI